MKTNENVWTFIMVVLLLIQFTYKLIVENTLSIITIYYLCVLAMLFKIISNYENELSKKKDVNYIMHEVKNGRTKRKSYS